MSLSMDNINTNQWSGVQFIEDGAIAAQLIFPIWIAIEGEMKDMLLMTSNPAIYVSLQYLGILDCVLKRLVSIHFKANVPLP